jgi:hypothetical protein
MPSELLDERVIPGFQQQEKSLEAAMQYVKKL